MGRQGLRRDPGSPQAAVEKAKEALEGRRRGHHQPGPGRTHAGLQRRRPGDVPEPRPQRREPDSSRRMGDMAAAGPETDGDRWESGDEEVVEADYEIVDEEK